MNNKSLWALTSTRVSCKDNGENFDSWKLRNGTILFLNLNCSFYESPMIMAFEMFGDESKQHYTSLHYAVLHCTALHCTALHYTALHFTALHCTALHFTALQHTSNCAAHTIHWLNKPSWTPDFHFTRFKHSSVGVSWWTGTNSNCRESSENNELLLWFIIIR